MVKTINDYIEALSKLFPELSKKDIKTILEYSWRRFYEFTLQGCDILIKSYLNNFWFHCGDIKSNPIEHFEYYREKLSRKIKAMYECTCKKWDGYYYTAIDEVLYKKIRKNPKNLLILNNKFICKSLDDVKIIYNLYKYFILFMSSEDLGYKVNVNNFKIENAKIIYTRDHYLSMLDLMKKY